MKKRHGKEIRIKEYCFPCPCLLTSGQYRARRRQLQHLQRTFHRNPPCGTEECSLRNPLLFQHTGAWPEGDSSRPLFPSIAVPLFQVDKFHTAPFTDEVRHNCCPRKILFFHILYSLFFKVINLMVKGLPLTFKYSEKIF